MSDVAMKSGTLPWYLLQLELLLQSTIKVSRN